MVLALLDSVHFLPFLVLVLSLLCFITNVHSTTPPPSKHVDRRYAAHITGGGLLENLPRVLPKNVDARLRAGEWQLPPVLRWLKREGCVATSEMARTFNCGVGMCLLVKEEDVSDILRRLRGKGEECWLIGDIIFGKGEVILEGADECWA